MKGNCEFNEEEESLTLGFGGKLQLGIGVEVGGEVKLKNPINQDVR